MPPRARIGSLLVFAPLLNAGIDSAVDAEGDEAIRNAVIAGAEVVIATTLGLTGTLQFRKFTLFGIELSATELLPDDETDEQTRFGNLAAMFDYAVDFVVNINLGILTIESARDQNLVPMPTRVRYRGFGLPPGLLDPDTYQPVFDTSRGFELGMAEPGALVVGGPLGPLLRVDSLKVARQNPLMLEMDLGLNANLGVVEVESVRVRMPIDPPGLPTIIPTAISVNIPGTLVGSGYLDIRDNGFAGAIDLTLVPLKLRMQASAGLERIDAGDRRITAFFLGLGVEFAAPIPVANSGLGLYGLLGLFGMHYKRDEEPPVNPNLPIALDWFYNKAKGEPHLIAVDGRRTWVASPDRWSFGVGVVLGTMEGAFILNLKGMLVLELPGPAHPDLRQGRDLQAAAASRQTGGPDGRHLRRRRSELPGRLHRGRADLQVRGEGSAADRGADRRRVPLPRRRRLASLHRQHAQQGLGRDSGHREGHRLPDVRRQGDSGFPARAAGRVLDRRRHRRLAAASATRVRGCTRASPGRSTWA